MALHGSINTVEVSVNTEADTSLLSTIVNIVPSNLVKPFVESDTLQIIFLAVLLGIAVGMIGRYTKVLMEVFEACNELFLTVTTLISKLIPAVVFAAVFLMIIQTGTDSLMAMISLTGTEVAAMIVMMMVYGRNQYPSDHSIAFPGEGMRCQRSGICIFLYCFHYSYALARYSGCSGGLHWYA